MVGCDDAADNVQVTNFQVKEFWFVAQARPE